MTFVMYLFAAYAKLTPFAAGCLWHVQVHIHTASSWCDARIADRALKANKME